MNWATERRIIIVTIISLVVVALAALALIATLHETPSCTDGVQNQDEAGIDCGGSCAYLCVAAQQAPTTLFTRALTQAPGRTDIIAAVLNKNFSAAAKDARYTLTLYGDDLTVLATREGTLDLPPAASAEGGRTLVYVPALFSGTARVKSASLTVDTASIHWFDFSEDSRIIPTVGNFTLTRETTMPRISAVLSNPSTQTLANVKTFVVVYDAAGNVLAASQTVVTAISPLGSAEAVFTWNEPFAAPVSRIEVTPFIPLP